MKTALLILPARTTGKKSSPKTLTLPNGTTASFKSG